MSEPQANEATDSGQLALYLAVGLAHVLRCGAKRRGECEDCDAARSRLDAYLETAGGGGDDG